MRHTALPVHGYLRTRKNFSLHINQYRMANGLNPLAMDESLDAVG